MFANNKKISESRCLSIGIISGSVPGLVKKKEETFEVSSFLSGHFRRAEDRVISCSEV